MRSPQKNPAACANATGRLIWRRYAGRTRLPAPDTPACQRGFSTLFITAHARSSQLMEARDERRLLKLQAKLQKVKLLIVDELGYVPLSQVGAELLFEAFSQRYERGSIIVTSNLPFEEWPAVFRCERLTGALLDRVTHHVHILEMDSESYRLKQSAGRRRVTTARAEQN